MVSYEPPIALSAFNHKPSTAVRTAASTGSVIEKHDLPALAVHPHMLAVLQPLGCAGNARHAVLVIGRAERAHLMRVLRACGTYPDGHSARTGGPPGPPGWKRPELPASLTERSPFLYPS